MHKTILVILIVILSIGLAVPVAAADISEAIYSGDIVTVNNSGTDYTGAIAAVTIPSDNMVSGGYMAVDYSDVAILTAGEDTVFMPGQGNDPWVMYIPSLLSWQSLTSTLYTSGATGGLIQYFPGDQGMTVADAASLELGNSFNVEWAGYVPTTGTLNSKDDAFVLETIDSTLSASILGATATVGGTSNQDTTVMLYTTANTRVGSRFNGTGTAKLITGAQIYLKIKGSPTGTAYLKVYNADTGANIATLGSIDVATLTDTFSLKTFADQAIIIPGDIDAYVVMEYTEGDASNGVYAGSTTMPSGTIPITRYADGAWTDYNNAPCVKLSYNPVLAYATHSIIPGDHVIAVTADGNYMTLSIDSTTVDTTSLAAVSVPDNGNSWISCINTPYMDYLKITVGGVLRQHIAWENAATFTDLSDNNNHATPTFRTTASSGITSTLTAIEAISPAVAPSGSLGGAINPISAAPTQPTGASWHTPSFDVPIVGDIINDLLDVSNTPYQFFWYPVATVILILLSFAAHKFAVSLFVKTSAVIMAVIIICAFNIFPWLVLPLIAIWNITILVHSQRGVL